MSSVITKYGYENPWKTIKIDCPWCGTSQTVKTVVNNCFYCLKEFAVEVNGNPVKLTEKQRYGFK